MILVNYTGRKGAGPLIAYEMTKALIDRGNEVAAIISSDVENLIEWRSLNIKKLHVIKTYRSKINFVLRSLFFYLFERHRLKREISKDKVSFIYCPMICPWTQMINSLFGVAEVVVAVHDPVAHSGEKLIDKILRTNKVIKRANLIVVHSKKYVKFIEEKYNKKSEVHYLPLGRHKYHKNNTVNISYSSNKINYLFFGRISQYKGLEILARAYKKVSQINKKVTLTIAGAGDFSKYEELYKNLPNVRIFNKWFHDSEVSSLFAGENIITLLPYIDATQSGVALVAMEHLSPIIATNTGGLSEQISNGITGVLIEPNNVEELIEAMLNLAVDKEFREGLAKNAFANLSKYEWNELANQLKNIVIGNRQAHKTDRLI